MAMVANFFICVADFFYPDKIMFQTNMLENEQKVNQLLLRQK